MSRTASSSRRLPVRQRNSQPRLDLQNFVPYLLAATLNQLIATSSRIYLQTHQCGMTEWRVLAMLAVRERLSSREICDRIGLDKSGVSRAIAGLTRRGHIKAEPSPTDGRSKLLHLTPTGQALHDRMIVTVLHHERQLLSGFLPQERRNLVKYLRRLLDSIKLVQGSGFDEVER